MIHFDNSTDWKEFNLENLPIRDTFKVPRYSWVDIGLIANNPGSWFLHCHITFAMEAGMARILNAAGIIPDPPNDYPIVDEYNNFDKSLASATVRIHITFSSLCFLFYFVW
jgi:hypothetical protein